MDYGLSCMGYGLRVVVSKTWVSGQEIWGMGYGLEDSSRFSRTKILSVSAVARVERQPKSFDSVHFCLKVFHHTSKAI